METIPEYVQKSDELKAKGVDAVYVIAVNDAAVMAAWAKDQKIEGSIVTFLADTRMEATDVIGIYVDGVAKLGNKRGGRYSMIVDDGVVQAMNVCEGDVPASESFVDKILADLDALAPAEAEEEAPAEEAPVDEAPAEPEA